ncbi:MAG: MerC domain-containing protein [Verrucomicrobiota bacterium]|nr:MerC domain-containing protein [Verrucomicrobiota bacterium]
MKMKRALAALDKLGAAGAILAAAAAPCCFPLPAMVGTALGLGALQSWLGYMDYAIQVFAGISVVGNIFAFCQHRRAWPLGVGLTSVALVFFAFYVSYQVAFIYTGLAGLAVAAVWNIVAKRRAGSSCRPVELQSTVACPQCGHQKTETMPTDACLYFYECENCHATLRPKPGDCCVFCSYGSVKCPPMQSGVGCCAT